ncbi:DUF6069 family protein [Georgenia subflava]|uniref:DUF6069 family protein n=1 Tax=Georgenia subflava TaxID=1622177 RepID=UPI00186B15F0|nr:DUF6069 family protein [Georgenia subflava]
MTTSPVRTRTPAHVGPDPGRYTLLTVACVAAATAANLGLFAVGRATDAALRVDPGVGAPNHPVIVGDVAWKTAVPLALGALVLALIARRSRRWTTVVTIAGAAVAAVSIPFVFTGSHDTVTGVLLSGMHTITGLAYVVIGLRARMSAAA